MFHSHRLAMRSGVDNGPEGKEVSAKAHKNAPDSNRGHRGDWRTYQSYQKDFRQGGAKTGEGRQCRCLGQNRQAACCRQAICRGASNSRNYSRRQRICIAFPQEGSSDQGEIEGILIPAMSALCFRTVFRGASLPESNDHPTAMAVYFIASSFCRCLCISRNTRKSRSKRGQAAGSGWRSRPRCRMAEQALARSG